jgi:hypothetical protein
MMNPATFPWFTHSATFGHQEINAMTVQAEFEYPVQIVHEALTAPGFLVDRSLALGEVCAECDVEESEGHTTINMVREVRRSLPGVLAKLFDPVSVMDMTEKWQPDGKGWRGDWTMKIRGQEVTILGSFELAPTSDGCRYSVSHQARAKIPFVGNQVERYILGQTVKGANDELGYLRDYLG